MNWVRHHWHHICRIPILVSLLVSSPPGVPCCHHDERSSVCHTHGSCGRAQSQCSSHSGSCLLRPAGALPSGKHDPDRYPTRVHRGARSVPRDCATLLRGRGDAVRCESNMHGQWRPQCLADAHVACSHHDKWEEQGHCPKELWRKAGDNGLLCPTMPEEYGGPGCDILYSAGTVTPPRVVGLQQWGR